MGKSQKVFRKGDLMVDGIDLVQLYQRRDTALTNEHNEYIPMWRGIRDFLGPRTAFFDGDKQNSGERKDLDILNNRPRFAVRTLPAGMQSGVTSPMRPWFRLGTPEPEMMDFYPIKEWLYTVEQRMYTVMRKSNFYDKTKSNYTILGLYGTSCLFIEEDDDDIIRVYDIPFGTFRFAQDATGRVNAMYRKVPMTVVQWIQKFGKENCPSNVIAAYERGDYDTTFEVLHVCEPNRLYKPGALGQMYKRYASVWIDCSQSNGYAIMRYSGFDFQPFLGPRWDVVGQSVYGFGCGEMALGDGKQLQHGEKRGLQMLDIYAHPIMQADASLRTHRAKALPGDTLYVNGLTAGRAGYMPAYQLNDLPINVLEEKQRQVEARVDEAFYKNLFMAVLDIGDQPNITATQINTLREERLMMLGPVLERLNDDLLDPVIDIVFSIMQNRGLLPPPPPELEGVPLKVEYVSVLAQAQKAMGLGNIERYIGFVQNLAAFEPSARHRMDIDEIIDAYADGVAVPPKLVRPRDEAQQMAEQEANAMRMAQMAEMGEKVSKSAQNVANIDMDGNNPMSSAIKAMQDATT